MNKIFLVLKNLLYWVSVGAMAAMLVLIFTEVVTRYLLGFSFEWCEELARFLFVWTTFIGSALMMGENGHLAVEFLPNTLKGKPAGIALEIFIKLCSYVFILILITQGWKMTTKMMFQLAPATDLPMGVVYSIIPVGATLMLFYLIRDTARFVGSLTAGRGRAQGGNQ